MPLFLMLSMPNFHQRQLEIIPSRILKCPRRVSGENDADILRRHAAAASR
jgi:hypothetical protein